MVIPGLAVVQDHLPGISIYFPEKDTYLGVTLLSVIFSRGPSIRWPKANRPFYLLVSLMFILVKVPPVYWVPQGATELEAPSFWHQYPLEVGERSLESKGVVLGWRSGGT